VVRREHIYTLYAPIEIAESIEYGVAVCLFCIAHIYGIVMMKGRCHGRGLLKIEDPHEAKF
jgi:hypothetical protein